MSSDEELAEAEHEARRLAASDIPEASGRCQRMPLTRIFRLVMAEYDRMRAELTKTVADCGICKYKPGGTIYIDDSCPEHGDHGFEFYEEDELFDA